MSSTLMVETRGDPLGTIRQILKTIWRNAKLEQMLIPSNGSNEVNQVPRLLFSPDEIELFNPFKPLMTSNTARFIPQLTQAEKAIRMGAVLRPCEMRALKGLERLHPMNTNSLLTISFDCLGTYPLEDFHWRTQRKGSAEQLAQETIQFAKQGGIVPYRFRSACQVCHSPASEDAHINIGVIGLPIRQVLLLTFREKVLENLLTNNGLSIDKADPKLINQHTLMIAKINERNHRVGDRIRQGMAEVFPDTIDQFIDTFTECGECQKCMQVCPICAVQMPIRSESGKYLLEEIVQWAESCAGCGMCDQVCPKHRPLSFFFSYVREQLIQESLSPTSSTKSTMIH
ncbi:MAG: hypothetical protein Kow0088_05850 [Anaerolineales bacterium]